MDDGELARQAKQGDIDAYETLLRRYQADAQRAAYLVTRHSEDAEDAVQAGFVRAWDALDSFDTRRPFRPWLLKIVTNQARDQLRAAKRRQKLRLRTVAEATRQQPSPERDWSGWRAVCPVLVRRSRCPQIEPGWRSARYLANVSSYHGW